jgi:glutathionylspermidine synthase
VPKLFIEAKKKAQAEIMKSVKKGLAARFGGGLSLFKNRSTVEASTDSGLSVDA